MDTNAITYGVLGVAALGAGFWALGKFGPGYAAGRVHEAFEALRNSYWVRDPERPQRARWLRATIELFEQEIPEPGTGQPFYEALGRELAAVVRIGSEEQWAKVARQIGDAVDTELDDELRQLTPLPPAA